MGGDANVGNLATESDAKINIQGDLLGTENQDIQIDGCIMNINGKAKANKLTIQGSAPKFMLAPLKLQTRQSSIQMEQSYTSTI